MLGELPPAPEGSIEHKETRQHPERIVVVDDDPLMTRAVFRMLSKHAQVVTYNEAALAIDSLRRLAQEKPSDIPHVIITDRDLDGGAVGENLIKEVRTIPGFEGVLFIGMSAIPESAEALKAAGAALVLNKPFKNEELVDYLFPKEEKKSE